MTASATSFATLSLGPAMQANLQRLGYLEMTPIQAASLPPALLGQDLIAQARTLAEQCIAQDPELNDPCLADIVLDMEMDAAGDWLERT